MKYIIEPILKGMLWIWFYVVEFLFVLLWTFSIKQARRNSSTSWLIIKDFSI